ncbi:FAD-binding dehydrogenase, partial [Mycobacterium kansasii]
TEKDLKLALGRVKSKGAPGPVEAFKRHGEDFIVADTLEELVAGMNRIGRGGHVDLDHLRTQIEARDRETANAFSKDAQLQAMHNARNYLGDKVVRVAKPHRILDPEHGPLIAVRLNILSRKTLGGLET